MKTITTAAGRLVTIATMCLGGLMVSGGITAARADANTEAADASSTARSTGGRLEEVIVTAQRREESLQKLPISVLAINEEVLGRLGATEIEKYAGFAPGLNLVSNSPGRSQIQMRGVTVGQVRADRPELGPTVGMYLDETPIAAQIVNANIGLLDLERVEVMRGPQATLYGAGSLSGTIRTITRKPDLSETAARFGTGASYTEHGAETLDFNGMVNVPLIENELGLRAVGFYRDQSGYIDNPILAKKDVNSYRDAGGRLALRFEPSETFRVTATAAYQDGDGDSDYLYMLEAGDLQKRSQAETPMSSEVGVASLVGELDFSSGTLTSATSYFRNQYTFDSELTRLVRLVTGEPFGGPPSDSDIIAIDTGHYDFKEFTQEIRYVSNREGRLSWIVGGLFQRKDHEYGEHFPAPGVDAITGIDSTEFMVGPDVLYDSLVDSVTKEYSVYGEATVSVTDKLTVKAGLRWFDVSQESSTFFGGLFSVPNVGRGAAEYSEDGVNPTFNISYAIDDQRMVYVQAARGFRLGGTNQPIPQQLCGPETAALGFSQPPTSFDSDSLWNYEAGLKSSWLNDRLRVNTAAYHIDWQDPPYALGLVCGFSAIVNAGSFDISGMELDIEASLAQGLVSRLGVSYTNSELGEDAPFVNGRKGDKAPFTPEFTASLSLDYDFPITAGLAAFVHGDVRWVDERVTTFASDPLAFNLSSYSEGNVRAGVSWDAWRIEALVSNVSDARPALIKSRAIYQQYPGTMATTLRPRTYGVQLTRDF